MSSPFSAFEKQALMPPKPAKPLPSDCCGLGCSPCVNDIYEQEMKNWRNTCEKIKRGEDLSAAAENTHIQMSPDNYSECTLEAITSVTKSVNSYRFKLLPNQALAFQPGQHLILKLETASQSFTRQYTLAVPNRQDITSTSNSSDSFEVFIKIYPQGRASCLIEKWSPGEKCLWRGPFGTFNYTPNSYSHVVILAVGTGTLPLLSIAQSILQMTDEAAAVDDETRIDVSLGFKCYSDFLLKNDWREVAGFWNVSLKLFLSQEEQEDVVSQRQKCRFAEICYSKIDHKYVGEKISRSPNSLFLICGTNEFEKSVIDFLLTSNVKECNIKKF